MKVQKIAVENKDYPLYILLDNYYEVIEPVMRFIKYLDNTGKSPNTIKTYCYHLKLFYVFIEQKGTTVSQIGFEDLASFIGWLRNPTGNLNTIEIQPNEAKRAESTVNAVLNAVVSFLEFLSRAGEIEPIDIYRQAKGRSFKGFLHHISKSKAYSKNVLKLRVRKKKINTLESSEVKTIVEACHTIRDQLIIMLMYEGGLRIGEVLSLRLEDVLTWDNQINIVPKSENANGAYIKLRKERTVHVSKELMSLYTDYLVYEYGEGYNHDYVFITLKQSYCGHPLKYQSVLDLIRRLRKRTGIVFNPHMLRHTHATELIREGWDMTYVQKRLGHAHVQTTVNTYVHLSDQDMKMEYQKYLERRV